MTKRQISEASTADLLDWLCYTCWHEYDKACKQGDRKQKQIENDILMMKEEILRRSK